MSRIGFKSITIDPGVIVTINEGSVLVVGPKGQLTVDIVPQVDVLLSSNILNVKMKDKNLDTSLLGLTRSLLQNAISGVTKEWSKSLELVGVGFRAETQGNDLVLHVGFSHPVKITAPSGIRFTIVENKITVSGSNKYMVGEIAACIKRVKPPEPYKGKGIRYFGEIIRKKLGKAAKAVGGAGGAK